MFDKGYKSGRGALSWLVQSSMEHVHLYDDRGYSGIEKDHLFPAWRHIIDGEFIKEPCTQGIIEGETFLYEDITDYIIYVTRYP